MEVGLQLYVLLGAQVLMTAAGNCVYGSALSPPRLQQIQETVDEYFETFGPSEELFQFWLPHLIPALKIQGLTLTTENCDQVLKRKRSIQLQFICLKKRKSKHMFFKDMFYVSN